MIIVNVLLLTHVLLIPNMMFADQIQNINIVAINVNGLTTSLPYVRELCQTNSIVMISEHMLYPCQAHRLNDIDERFNVEYKCSNRLDDDNCGKIIGSGGVCIMYQSDLSPYIKCIPDIESDRICGICLNYDNLIIDIYAVYLPHRGCQISDFDECLDILESCIIDSHNSGHYVAILGDMNAHIGAELGTSLNSQRCWGASTRQGQMIVNLAKRQGCKIIDLLKKCKGPNYTFQNSMGFKSYIDHCVTSLELINIISSIETLDEHSMNVSDHRPIRLCIPMSSKPNPPVSSESKNNANYKWHSYSRGDIHYAYTLPLRHELSNIMLCHGISSPDDILEKHQIDDVILDINKAMIVLSDASIEKATYKK